MRCFLPQHLFLLCTCAPALFGQLINYGTVLNAGNVRCNELSVLTIKFYVLDQF